MKIYQGFRTGRLPCPVCGNITEIGAFIRRGNGRVFVCRYCSEQEPQIILQAIRNRAAHGLPVTIEQHRRAGTMNGYKVLAEQHRKAGNEQQAAIYDFLAKCDIDDICNLFNSTAFNEIAKGYLRLAVDELTAEGTITAEQAKAVVSTYTFLLDEKRAQETI